MKSNSIVAVILAVLLLISGCAKSNTPTDNSSKLPEGYISSVYEVPQYCGNPYVEIRNNEPEFAADDLVTESYESYSPLDLLGRCGVAQACIGVDIMPTEKRGNIGQVKPSGWQTVKYDSVDGKYLYNRCHLIGYQLTGENANEKNLITGTRYLNVEGMLPFENMVADYVKETENHVLYRVTPVFDGVNLVASGVQIEAKSVEDDGEGICFNIYAYNIQPGIEIDYLTGESKLYDKNNTDTDYSSASPEQTEYILNISSKKFHLPSCSLALDIKETNKKLFSGSKDELIGQGYSPCKGCNP